MVKNGNLLKYLSPPIFTSSSSSSFFIYFFRVTTTRRSDFQRIPLIHWNLILREWKSVSFSSARLLNISRVSEKSNIRVSMENLMFHHRFNVSYITSLMFNNLIDRRENARVKKVWKRERQSLMTTTMWTIFIQRRMKYLITHHIDFIILCRLYSHVSTVTTPGGGGTREKQKEKDPELPTLKRELEKWQQKSLAYNVSV